jgi:tetratricopeptide (TPR) repeat protein
VNSSDRHDRYPGPRPYEDAEIDRKLFFGRHGEANELLYRVMGNRVLLLFGKSGTGKSSLLQAGLFPLLREQHMLPLPVRPEPLEILFSTIEEICTKNEIDHTPGDTRGLWEYFKTATFWHEGFLLTPVLVLDQFEEIFTLLWSQDRQVITRHLGELVGGAVPQRLRSSAPRTESSLFDEKPPSVKIILSLREDYLGALQELTREIPGLFENRFRLAAMDKTKAREAVLRPAELPQEETFATRSFRYEDSAREELVDFLAGETGEVEPFQLQILCLEIEKRVAKVQGESQQEVVVDRAFLGGRERMDTILQGFYEDVLQKFPWFIKRKRVRNLCENGLLIAGHRCLLEANRISTLFMIRADDLRTLVDLRLLRKEERSKVYYYELSHDSLIQPVLKSNKRFRQRRRRILIGLVLAGFLAIGLNGLAVYYRDTAVERLFKEVDTLFYEGWPLARDAGGAAELYRKALHALEKVADQQSNNFSALGEVHNRFISIGDNLQKIGDPKKALAAYKKALNICGDFLKRNPNDTSWLEKAASSNSAIGGLLLESDDLKGAEEAYEESRKLYLKLTNQNPNNYNWMRSLGLCYCVIGDVRMNRKDHKGAEEAYLQFQKISLELTEKHPGNTLFQQDLGWSYQRIGSIREATDDSRGEEEAYQQFQKIFSALQQTRPYGGAYYYRQPWSSERDEIPRNLGKSYSWIGDSRMKSDDPKGAKEAYEQYLKAFIRLSRGEASADTLHEVAQAHKKIGEALEKSSNTWAAENAYRESLEVLSTLREEYPAKNEWQEELGQNCIKVGDLRNANGDLTGAKEAFQRAHEVFSELIRKEPDNTNWQERLGVSSLKIGQICLDAGDLIGAEQSFRHYQKVFSELAAKDPNNPDWQREIGVSHSWIGVVRMRNGDHHEAEKAFTQCLEIFSALATNDPNNTDWQREIGVSHSWIGEVRMRNNDHRGAEKAFTQSLKIYAALAAREPDKTEWQREIGVSHSWIGEVRMRNNDHRGAEKAFTQRLKIYAALAAKEPDKTEWQRGIGVSHSWIGEVRMRNGNHRGAEKAFTQSLKIYAALAAREPDNTEWQLALGRAYCDIANVRKMDGDLKGALAAYEKALDLTGTREPD